jgi:peptidoglycan/xylan/chitin deacetylase (PgdA/CDA1 family)
VISVVFRFDDPSPKSDSDLEREVLAEFAKRELPLTVAVVPFALNGSELLALSDRDVHHLLRGSNAGLVEIALHGFAHTPSACSTPGARSEFIGLAINDQDRMIREGREQLEQKFQRPILGFVPPFNSYDSTTISVLQKHNFGYISADFRSPPAARIPLLPATIRPSQLEQAAEEASRFIHLDPVIVVMLHHYDFRRDDGDPPGPTFSMSEFGAILDRLDNQTSVQVRTLEQIARQPRATKLAWPIHNRLKKMLPYRFSKWLPSHCFLMKRLRPRLSAVKA